MILARKLTIIPLNEVEKTYSLQVLQTEEEDGKIINFTLSDFTKEIPFTTYESRHMILHQVQDKSWKIRLS